MVNQNVIVYLSQGLRRISAHDNTQSLPRHTDELATYKISKYIITKGFWGLRDSTISRYASKASSTAKGYGSIGHWQVSIPCRIIDKKTDTLAISHNQEI